MKRNGSEQDGHAGKPQFQNNAKGIQREPDRADAGTGVRRGRESELLSQDEGLPAVR